MLCTNKRRCAKCGKEIKSKSLCGKQIIEVKDTFFNSQEKNVKVSPMKKVYCPVCILETLKKNVATLSKEQKFVENWIAFTNSDVTATETRLQS